MLGGDVERFKQTISELQGSAYARLSCQRPKSKIGKGWIMQVESIGAASAPILVRPLTDDEIEQVAGATWYEGQYSSELMWEDHYAYLTFQGYYCEFGYLITMMGVEIDDETHEMVGEPYYWQYERITSLSTVYCCGNTT